MYKLIAPKLKVPQKVITKRDTKKALTAAVRFVR